jgi:sialate O-acetylesterase
MKQYYKGGGFNMGKPKSKRYLKLPRLISDGMVLQRDCKIKIWGWANFGENIIIDFLTNTYNTVATDLEKWEIEIPNLQAGGPYKMEIKACETITIKNIMIGDVWVCSGQSNMELPISRVNNIYKSETIKVNNAFIREFAISKKYNFNEIQENLDEAVWKEATQENIYGFSAVAYFFAAELYQKYKIPIGLIRNAVGGTPIQAWISEEYIKKFPEYLSILEKCKDDNYVASTIKSDTIRNDSWHKKLNSTDLGLTENKQWFNESYDFTNWREWELTDNWQDNEYINTNGSIWFTKVIDVPISMTNKVAKLSLGRIIDADRTYINGVFVGSVEYQYPPREYDIPCNLLRVGENTITVRVISVDGVGGFVKDKPYKLFTDTEKIDLNGKWKYKVGANMDNLVPATNFEYQPSGLYNAIIAPILKYAIKGVIWYQGESNTKYPNDYYELFVNLLENWRSKWNIGDFHFIFVQLANYMNYSNIPQESIWAELREQQLKGLSEKNTGMAVAIDLGEYNDIHPLNKKDVALRLSLSARKVAYGEDIVHSGPIYNSDFVSEGKITISFTNVGSGLISKNSHMLQGFCIAGVDKIFVNANAVIDGATVIVSSEKIIKPAYVRYAWADNPQDANLYNIEGLPASPFRSDFA